MKSSCVALVYDHFYPDFSAGGPVTSLYNLSQLLKDSSDVRIIASAFEYKTHKSLEVSADQWSESGGIKMWYASNRQSVKDAIITLPAGSTVYLNGIFSPVFFLYPLWIASRSKLRVVISPRGMLQAGALKSKTLKKKLFLLGLKLSSFLKHTEWHATDVQERRDILSFAGQDKKVTVLANVPTQPVSQDIIAKEKGDLRLIYLSIIAEKKNLLFLLRLLSHPLLHNVKLHIAGPVKDEEYWSQCLTEIQKSDGRVSYSGAVPPQEVMKTIGRYHALVLPTKGENFGHAIVESFASSRPVIISDKTPWSDVTERGCGFVVREENQLWQNAILSMLNWDQRDFNAACLSSLQYYQYKFDFEKLKTDYINLLLQNN